MAELFVRLVNMSITASLIALLLLLLRFLLRGRLPATFSYLLWGTVFFRLLVPWSLPAALSIFNLTGGDLPQPSGGYVVTLDYLESGYVPLHQPDTQSLFLVCSVIWLTVAVLLGLYLLAVSWDVRRRAKTVFPLRQCDELLDYCKTLVPVRQRVRVYHSSAFASPIVLGSLHPRIILPSGMDFSDSRRLIHIFTHELTHIRRMDFLAKKLALLCLILHWFNPLVFLCYQLFSRDIEASCDEGVLRVLGEQEKMGYADSLLSLFTQLRTSWGSSTLAFGETALKQRVKGAIGYRQLSPLRLLLLSVLVITIGAATTTNPLSVSDGYVPVERKVSALIRGDFEKTAVALSTALTQGDVRGLLQNTRSRDEYYVPLYGWLEKSPLVIDSYKLYPQSEESAYCYLKAADHTEYTAVMSRKNDRVQLEAIYPAQIFEASMSVPEECEQVRFVRNLHRFGIRTGFGDAAAIPRPSIAALCIDEEYRDRVKSGELAPEEKYLPPAWIAQAAQDYFGLADFSYTFDSELYDSTRNKYIYDANRGERCEAVIVAQWEQEGTSYVTAQFYTDPLHMTVDKTITYSLRKK